MPFEMQEKLSVPLTYLSNNILSMDGLNFTITGWLAIIIIISRQMIYKDKIE